FAGLESADDIVDQQEAGRNDSDRGSRRAGAACDSGSDREGARDRSERQGDVGLQGEGQAALRRNEPKVNAARKPKELLVNGVARVALHPARLDVLLGEALRGAEHHRYTPLIRATMRMFRFGKSPSRSAKASQKKK